MGWSLLLSVTEPDEGGATQRMIQVQDTIRTLYKKNSFINPETGWLLLLSVIEPSEGGASQ